MAKRIKRLKKGAESIKEEIEKHFLKLEKDIEENRIEAGEYHAKEIEKSLIKALELKIELLGIKDNSAEEYKKRLNKLRENFERDE